jgi:hypothetical protein
MPVLRPAAALLALSVVVALSALQSTAQDARPEPLFNEHIEWDEAARLAQRAQQGDQAAAETMRRGRLAYVPLLLNFRTADPRALPRPPHSARPHGLGPQDAALGSRAGGHEPGCHC